MKGNLEMINNTINDDKTIADGGEGAESGKSTNRWKPKGE